MNEREDLRQNSGGSARKGAISLSETVRVYIIVEPLIISTAYTEEQKSPGPNEKDGLVPLNIPKILYERHMKALTEVNYTSRELMNYRKNGKRRST